MFNNSINLINRFINTDKCLKNHSLEVDQFINLKLFLI